MNIVVRQPTANIGSQLSSISHILTSMNGSNDPSDTINLSNIRFVFPLFSLALCCLKDQAEKIGKQINYILPTSYNCGFYFRTIHFPDAMTMETNGTSNKFNLNNYLHKAYLPIIKFPTLNDSNSSLIRDQIISEVNNKIRNNLNLNNEYNNAVLYLISELTDNIVEHSCEVNGYINAQYYEKRKELDITIIDNGISILGSYQQSKIVEILTDIQAITAAISGRSTKQEPRGFGLITSRNMITNGLQGGFVLYSGNGLLLNNELIEMPAQWTGTILALRIPYDVPNFRYIAYV